MTPFWRAIRILAVVLVLLLAVWLGLKEGSDTLRDADTVAQRVAAATQIIYGIAASACLWALSRQRAWLGTALVLWGLTLTITGTLAPVVWGGTGWGGGALGGVTTAAVAGLTVWGALAHAGGRAHLPAVPERPKASAS